jgi:DNA-binding transcriptional ArsR family regulator
VRAADASVPTEVSDPYGGRVIGEAQIADVARLLGDPTRAAMCTTMLDGRFHTAGELARAAGVAPSTASEHLGRLLDGGLVEATRQGRHRYYRLSGPDVAAALEALGVLAAAAPVRSLRAATASERLRAGRTCYDHLAGELGMAVTERLVTAGVLGGDLAVRDLGPLAPLGLELAPTAPSGRGRPLVRPCLDWTERRHHVAGALPAAFTARLLELGWLRRLPTPRAVRLTDAGHEGLAALLGPATERRAQLPA